MEPDQLGTVEFTEEDRAYRGSRFSEVRDALFANPYQRIWGGAGEPPLPVYAVTLGSVMRGMLPFGGPHRFRQATERAVDSAADLRWGANRRGFRRLLHPNGVCLTGLWEITEATPYSGYFRQGSRALIVGRYSTCCTETRRGHARSLSLVGKLFPTTDAEHTEPLRTANFITQQDLGGDHTDYINDAETRNAPDITATAPRGRRADPAHHRDGVRQGRQGAGEPPALRDRRTGQAGRQSRRGRRNSCAWWCLRASRGSRGRAWISGTRSWRRSSTGAMPGPSGTLTFHIEVTDEGTMRGTPVLLRRTFRNWRHVGRIVFRDAVVSYNGDFVIHFNHPTWRDDRNDPASATRVEGRKVR